MLDNALSAVLILILGLLSAVPVFLLFARYPDLDILKLSRGIWGRAGIWVPVFYSAYFVLMGCYYVSFFETFIGNVTGSENAGMAGGTRDHCSLLLRRKAWD